MSGEKNDMPNENGNTEKETERNTISKRYVKLLGFYKTITSAF